MYENADLSAAKTNCYFLNLKLSICSPDPQWLGNALSVLGTEVKGVILKEMGKFNCNLFISGMVVIPVSNFALVLGWWEKKNVSVKNRLIHDCQIVPRYKLLHPYPTLTPFWVALTQFWDRPNQREVKEKMQMVSKFFVHQCLHFLEFVSRIWEIRLQPIRSEAIAKLNIQMKNYKKQLNLKMFCYLC